MIQGAHWPPSEYIIQHFLFSFRDCVFLVGESGILHGLLCIGNHVLLIYFQNWKTPYELAHLKKEDYHWHENMC